VIIPTNINGLLVTCLGGSEDGFTSIFDGIAVTGVTIPDSVTSIGPFAFANCFNLASVYFTGNAPAVGLGTFIEDPTTIYYLPGTTGWSNTYAYSPSVPAVLWNPLIQIGDGSFGVLNNQFGFNINGTNNFTVVVEACTNLANPVWTPLQTVTLTNGSFYFSEPLQTNSPNRFYGLGLP
jgi:hypothetical protein